MKTTSSNPNYEEIRAFLRLEYQLIPLDFISKGHLKLPILRSRDKDGRALVVKVGIGAEGAGEVLANMFGYQSMIEAGAGKMVPDYLQLIETPWGPALFMQDLGVDYVTTIKTENESAENARILGNNLEEVCIMSLCKGKDLAESGILEIKSQLIGWFLKLNQLGFIEDAIICKLRSLDVTRAVSELSTVMILDFTPDNLFIFDQRAVFIDPWKQSTYLGTMIPSIAQFCTLARNIYSMPSPKVFEDLLSVSYKIGERQHLDRTQIDVQIALGTALQYSLSAYVRVVSNPELATKFSAVAVSTIASIV